MTPKNTVENPADCYVKNILSILLKSSSFWLSRKAFILLGVGGWERERAPEKRERKHAKVFWRHDRMFEVRGKFHMKWFVGFIDSWIRAWTVNSDDQNKEWLNFGLVVSYSKCLSELVYCWPFESLDHLPTVLKGSTTELVREVNWFWVSFLQQCTVGFSSNIIRLGQQGPPPSHTMYGEQNRAVNVNLLQPLKHVKSHRHRFVFVHTSSKSMNKRHERATMHAHRASVECKRTEKQIFHMKTDFNFF